ncbi:MAG: SDR family NAD(P)-dependent oxidoreductase [Acidimicrobiales bacterium]
MNLDYTNTTVLVTGGTGSFGNAVVEHLFQRECREVRVLSRDEEKQEAMRNRLAGRGNIRCFIGDVRSRASVDRVMPGVDLVFHAAALKQVPSCEFFPLEAVATNVLGSGHVIDSAVAHGVGHVVLLGTDKAVYPINAMGMTKALMEKVGQATARQLALDGSNTTVCSVRYGNVLYSRGSVVPLFVEQALRGEPVTVTEPSMTRFLLPLADAVELVELAFARGENGDVLIRKAPASTIGDLAQAVQNVLGRVVGTKVIGIRHGEKLYETLATRQELRQAEDLGEYYRVRMDDRDLNYALYFSEGDPDEATFDDYHSHNTTRLTVPEVEQVLLSLPEIQAALEDS